MGGFSLYVMFVCPTKIIETFLSEILGLEWDKVYAQSERLEHVISEELEAKIDAKLGYSTRDPHGAPIPSLDGKIEVLTEMRLSDTKAGFEGHDCRVADENPAVLRHLSALQLCLGAAVEVLRAEAIEGVLKHKVAGHETTLGHIPAQAVWVGKLKRFERRARG